MIGPADLTQWRHDAEFRDDPIPLLVLDRDLVIRAVNRSHEQAMGSPAEALLGLDVFTAYPANALVADGDDGQRSMAASFERVLREERPHDLVIQRYDVPDRSRPGEFLHRTWLPMNSPVWAAGAVAGIAVRAEPIEVSAALEALLRGFRDQLREQRDPDDPLAPVVAAVVGALRSWSETLAEVRQLREALTSRASIDQAKGILMERQGVDPDEAFRTLVQLSNETNVRLAEVASALVYQVQQRATD